MVVEKKIHISLEQPPNIKEISITRFEELFDLHYLPQLEFEHWETEQWIKKRSAEALKKGKIGQLALWLGKLHGKDLDNADIPDLSVSWIEGRIGYGLIALRPFQKWEFIGEYTGILRRRRIIFPDVNDYCFMYPKEWISLRAYTIDSRTHGNYTRFINHSDTPNCESVGVFHNGIFHILLRTIHEVAKGEQLTYDYGDVYWRKRKKI